MPIGGVVAYDGAISPSGVGFDIGCGNMAVKTNLLGSDIPGKDFLLRIVQEIQRQVAFGIGRSNVHPVDDPVLDMSSTWQEIEKQFGPALREKAAQQLGTVGSGNHYVDLLVDEDDVLWIANHFGSRGLGHTIASGFMAKAAGVNFTDRVPETEEPCVLDVTSELGAFYVAAMHLAGNYAYSGREYVTQQVLSILGAEEVETVHNHHNFAWYENGLWVVRKGATPLTAEPAYIGGSMGEGAVIVRGTTKFVPGEIELDVYNQFADFGVKDIGALGSAPHGAGRVMSRTQAAGKMRKMWLCPNRNCDFEPIRCSGPDSGHPSNHCPKCSIPLRRERLRDRETAQIDWTLERNKLKERGIIVLGADADEAPGVYKNLPVVLAAHSNIEILHTLRPIGVVMAGSDIRDPYSD